MLHNIYQEKITAYQARLKMQRGQDIRFSAFRFTLILLSALCFYFVLDGASDLLIGAGALFFISFVGALLMHLKLRKAIKRTRHLILINEGEIDYLSSELKDYNRGDEFKNGDHLYTNDLDIFGSNSLFQHINRTTTQKGRISLANSLSSNNPTNINTRQEGIREISSKLDWRQSFRATGMSVSEDNEIDRKLKFWLAKQEARPSFISKYILIPLAVLCFGLLANWLINPGIQTFNWFSYSFMLNLLLVFSQFKLIKKEYEGLSGISKSIGVYSELIREIENQEFESDLLKEQQQKLYDDNINASKALKQLSKILDGFDQLNNIVALFVTNGLYHFHLHTLNNLIEWKAKHGKNINKWIATISEFDELESIGNYAYNHPEYCYPEIAEEAVFQAENIGHPLLNPKKRIDNSVDFQKFQYVLLTGSNMSGKSTFLRSLGVNLVLFKMGAPVCALNMTSFPFKILTSMKLVDSIEKEESYFQAEVLRLKSIQSELREDYPSFVLLDEILRGTNSDDKRNGTRLFMERITAYKAKGVIATHDIDIAELAEEKPQNFEAKYFESTVSGDELMFDYKLRNGVCKTPNATRLMQAQGII